MQLISHDAAGLDNQFVVKLDQNRQAYLVVRKDSHPLMVASASANVGTGNSFAETRAAIDEASTWLLEEIRKGNIQLK